MLSCYHAEILNILSLNLHFVSKVNEQWSRRDTCNVCVATPCAPLYTDQLWCPSSREFWWAHHTWELGKTQSKYKASTQCLQLSSRCEASRSRIFHCNQNLLGTQKEAMAFEETNNQWILQYYFLMQIKHLHWKYVSDVKKKRKGKIGQSIVPCLLILLSVSQRKSTGRMQNKHSCSCTVWCSTSTVLVRAMYELQNTNCAILVISHMSRMLLNLHFKPALHDIRVNSKIHNYENL